MSVVLKDIENGICTLTINRPEQYNALNHDVLVELDSILDSIHKESQCRVVILTGSGNKAFIAGADIKRMQRFNENKAQDFSKMGQNLTTKIEEFGIPIIAAINGFTLGGGCEIAMACHIRYAAKNAVFGQPEVGLGLIAGWGGTQRLPRLIGKGRALEMLLAGNVINAEEALSIGLVNKVLPADELMFSVEKLATLIIKNAPQSISATIRLVNKREISSIKDGLAREQEEFSSLFNTKDTYEGLSAFMEKRKPVFRGR